MVLLGMGAARLGGAASAALLRRKWAILILSGMQVPLKTFAKMLRSSRGLSPPTTAAQQQAEGIILILRERGIIPNKLGIDGVPGSGKSTLARALAAGLDMKWKSLDYKNLALPENLEQERTIYEHHRLLRTQDVDVFDAIAYIDEPVERSRARVRRRGRGLLLAALLDYNKLKKVGEIAFDVCDGEPIVIPGSYLILKITPPGGFRANENIAKRLSTAGFNTSGMSKEEMLFLLAYGRRQDGLKAYLLPLAWITRIGSMAAELQLAGQRLRTALRAKNPTSGRRGACASACG